MVKLQLVMNVWRAVSTPFTHVHSLTHHINLKSLDVQEIEEEELHPIRRPANVISWYKRILNAQDRWPVTLRHVFLYLCNSSVLYNVQASAKAAKDFHSRLWPKVNNNLLNALHDSFPHVVFLLGWGHPIVMCERHKYSVE
ncbi:hypothetical protein E2C01_008052 [Portunus trituberculatus]|uniref:Uncharacterized protein n=1 Tax=Portunus trituberculatus TaxID=210409 RepID=A0A5B7D3V2_PORTR|nr:hypothetical protein [Portunus trituberculatus]